MGDPRIEELTKQGKSHGGRIAELERMRLADSMKQYMYNALTGTVRREYDSQMTVWKIHLNTLIGYCHQALARHQNEIDQEKRNAERAQEMAMFILALMAGPALSFVSGVIQYRLAPSFLGNRTSAKVTIPNPKYEPPAPPAPRLDPPVTLPKAGRTISPVIPRGSNQTPGKTRLPHAARTIDPTTPSPKPPSPPTPSVPKMIEFELFDPNLDKTTAKVFGDLGSTAATLLGSTIAPPEPPNKNLLDAANGVASATSLAMLESRLRNVWEAANDKAAIALQNYANVISNDVRWGDSLLAGQIPGVTQYPANKGYGRDAEDHYQRQLRVLIDKQRQQWGREWFYYGNNPAPLAANHAVSAIETEMWAQWILSEHFHVTQVCKTDRTGTGCWVNGAIGDSGLKIERFARRLLVLGIIEGNEILERHRRNLPGPVDDGLQPVEIADIYGDVDTVSEFGSIIGWASNRKPGILGGNGFGASVPRPINPLNHTDIKP